MFKRKPEPSLQEVLDKYGLDLGNYSQEQIKEENVKNIQKIARGMRGNKWIQAGFDVQLGKAFEKAMMSYQSAMIEQNWIIIRQNEIIIKSLEKK